ncbi:hypothetical protein O9993_16535 [Vibrio lentus]|nr:hypothetical protein [Vibrio lentus]
MVSDSPPWISLELNIQDATNNFFANFIGEFWFNIIEKKKRGIYRAKAGFAIVGDTRPLTLEIGYWLKTSQTGFGYVSEAIRTSKSMHSFKKVRNESKLGSSNLKVGRTTRWDNNKQACFANDLDVCHQES